ncbi:HK97-gp10 family putative phage morphogenesis protein [Hyphomicrobium zavarzinii]|uniref:HK97-gp10 family putative phage morphogenesis protein n=1 Tax=Hyphomicrobium zavarzinii TaxID=48292 RepID=UPI0003621503|nr:HK97-gp10 family putative phage morphogenesis protein [Hyphomicrobium zavarzinii]
MSKIKGVRELNLKLGKIGPAVIAEIRRSLRRGSQKIQNTAASGIMESGSKNNPGPSKPGEYPAGKSAGGLASGITSVEASSPGVVRFVNGATAPYAEHLEFGTSKMAPRPFMAPSFDRHVDAIKTDIRAAVKRGIRKGASR